MASLQEALRNVGLSSTPDAAQAQPNLEQLAQKAVDVTKREKLWSGGVVQTTIPKLGQEGIRDARFSRVITADTPQGPLTYLQFGKLLRGGVINVFVHGTTPKDYAGKKILAKMEVMRKDMEDGRSFLYIDLYPVAEGTKVTNRFDVMQPNGNVEPWTKLATAFKTPAPLNGAVVIIGADEKFI